MSDISRKLPEHIEDWTKDHVRQWLLNELKISQEHADRLYNEDTTGASLVCYEKQDLLDLGLKHGPAVQIIHNVRRHTNTSRDQPSKKTKVNPSLQNRQEKIASTNDAESSNTSNKDVGNQREHIHKAQDVMGAGHLSEHTRAQHGAFTVSQPCEQQSDCSSTMKENVQLDETRGTASAGEPKNETLGVTTVEKRKCCPRPFDKSGESYNYRQNDILPPETGPGNLLDPVREFKLLGNTENASQAEIMRKFTNETFRFAAGCMNSRTNGTIYFGVSDEPHGQIVGIQGPEKDGIIDKFDRQLREYFEEETDVARSCIRQPQFITVLHPNDVTSDRYVIEIDIVPDVTLTQEKLFYTNTFTQDDKGKKCKHRCVFIREGASTVNILANKDPRQVQEKLKRLTSDVKDLESLRIKNAAKGSHELKHSVQGHRLKQLMLAGRHTLDNSFCYIVVTNKCPSSLLNDLNFLKEIRPLVVLDFDPESNVNGSCDFFRRDHIANLHYPQMYNTTDNTSTIIEKLNLFRQTSWVFCNGQTNEEGDSDKPLDSGSWLKRRANEVKDMITFLCSSDVLQRKRLVVMFLIHTAVTEMSDPFLETFCTLYQKLEGPENMLCICKDTDVFSHWRDLVENRLQADISSKCISDLSLHEVNCTIIKMKGPQTQSSKQYLPSYGGSSVLLTEKDKEFMTVLDILCENECEDTEIESSDSFISFKEKIEEDFYRGGKVTWWNFYFSEAPGCVPFIKRDKFQELCELITTQEHNPSSCVIVNLFHHPGCGGTTLAMHVLWDMRRKFRCAVLKNSTGQSTEIAVQVTHLLTCGKEGQTNFTPVLLLVDDWEDIEDLQRSILIAAHDKRNLERVMVFILNCVRSQLPAESSTKSRISNIYITNKLSQKEQGFFDKKLEELKGKHEKPETFYAFMIMTNNFSEEYIQKLVGNVLKNLNTSSKEGQLLSFLALLNTYLDGSSMSLSLCEECVGIRNALWQQESLEDKMNPYSTLLICFSVEEYGTYQAVRFLHQMIAKSCLDVITTKHDISLSEITLNLLHCDLLYKSSMGKDILIQNIISMLITRNRKELGDDKDTLFSPLVEQIQETERNDQMKGVLIEATKRFDKNATVPQALARYFYLKVKDFQSALQWALDAQQKMNNSYIADTLGQVYKSHLKHMIDQARNLHQELTPQDLEEYLKLATKAMEAFKNAQELAKKGENMESFDQRNKRKQRIYNTAGHLGAIDVATIIFDVLQQIPFFEKSNELKRQTMLKFLNNLLPARDFREDSGNLSEDFIPTLKEHEKFLVSLKPQVKESFQFFEDYFTYLKPRSLERQTAEERNKRKVSEHFKKYVKVFCASGEERESERMSKPKLSLHQEIENARLYLEEKRADTFSGLLQYLNEKNGYQMEKITTKWQFIFENSPRKRLFDKVNYILVNIILHCMKPKSQMVKKDEELLKLLNLTLQEEGIHSSHTELYYLAMLLLWPTRDSLGNQSSKNICMYVSSIKKSFSRRFSHLCYAKSPTTHFYLGKSKGLKRIIHKGKLDQTLDKEKHSRSHQLWQSGAIWKEPSVEQLLERVQGTTENGEIYVRYGHNKITVRPVYLGGIRSGCSVENVSFYLGFSMEGPMAYDIKYKNDM